MSGKMTWANYVEYRKSDNPDFGESDLPQFNVIQEIADIQVSDVTDGYPGDIAKITIPTGTTLMTTRLVKLSGEFVCYAKVTLDGRKYEEIPISIEIMPTGSIAGNIELVKEYSGGKRKTRHRRKSHARKSHRKSRS